MCKRERKSERKRERERKREKEKEREKGETVCVCKRKRECVMRDDGTSRYHPSPHAEQFFSSGETSKTI